MARELGIAAAFIALTFLAAWAASKGGIEAIGPILEALQCQEARCA